MENKEGGAQSVVPPCRWGVPAMGVVGESTQHSAEGTHGDKNKLGELSDFFFKKEVSSFIIKNGTFPF